MGADGHNGILNLVFSRFGRHEQITYSALINDYEFNNGVANEIRLAGIYGATADFGEEHILTRQQLYSKRSIRCGSKEICGGLELAHDDGNPLTEEYKMTPKIPISMTAPIIK